MPAVDVARELLDQPEYRVEGPLKVTGAARYTADVQMPGMTGSTLPTIVVVLGVIGWVQYARVIRGQTLSLREREFVLAAHVCGASNARIIFRHIFPNTLGPLAVIATVNVSAMILAEASLSFLGIGIRPPTAAWGTMLSEGREVFATAWWNAVFPGLAIVWTVFGINLLGDAWQQRR